MIIIEENFNDLTVTESKQEGGSKLLLRGVFAEAETKNRNNRQYRLSEMISQVQKVNEAAQIGRHILGELDHPNNLEIKLKNVSHRLNRMWMEGNIAYGEAEILRNHPNGKILEGLMKDGVQIGVSTRGSGQIKNGIVESFNLVTVDAVATPSARSAYPETIQEQLEMYKNGQLISEMAEDLAILHDPKTQRFFENELRKFIDSMKLRTK